MNSRNNYSILCVHNSHRAYHYQYWDNGRVNLVLESIESDASVAGKGKTNLVTIFGKFYHFMR